MRRPNLTITKKLIISRQGHFRYYHPELTYDIWHKLRYRKRRAGEKKFPKCPVITLDPNDNRYPNISNIQTEKQLCRFVYDKWGSGEYRFIGHAKGVKGGWTFWKGEINEQGFCFERKNRMDTEEMRILRRDLKETSDPEEQKEILEDMESIKEMAMVVRYGFSPHLISSGRRGEFVSWADEDEAIIKQQEKETEEIW